MTNSKKEYPGFLVFFDKVEGLVNHLDDERLGKVFRAMYEYSRNGQEPNELDDASAIIWPILRTMLDNDRESYNQKCDQGAYAASCRVAEAKNEPKPDREQFFAARRADRMPEIPVRTETQKAVDDYETALRRKLAYTSENKDYRSF